MNINLKKSLLSSKPQISPTVTQVDQSNSNIAYKTDQEIWRSFKNDDKEAFIHIYTKYFKILYNYGHKMCIEEELIKDCIHDVFAQINESKRRLSDVTNIKLYLLKSFKTRFLFYQKKNSYFVSESTFSEDTWFDFSLSIEQKIINAQLDEERIARLNHAIRSLSNRQKEVIYYFFYEELSIDDIKELMEVGSRRTIQNLVYRAVASLRNALISLMSLCAPYLFFNGQYSL